jgi:hypothetical protein
LSQVRKNVDLTSSLSIEPHFSYWGHWWNCTNSWRRCRKLKNKETWRARRALGRKSRGWGLVWLADTRGGNTRHVSGTHIFWCHQHCKASFLNKKLHPAFNLLANPIASAPGGNLNKWDTKSLLNVDTQTLPEDIKSPFGQRKRLVR